MDFKALAVEMGVSEPYDDVEGFKAAFEDICRVVEKLPPDLLERGRNLPYPQLHWAARQGDLAMVCALLSAGVGADSYTYFEDDEDETALVWLAETDGLDTDLKIQIAQALIAKGAYMDEALARANDNADDRFAAYLRTQGALD